MKSINLLILSLITSCSYGQNCNYFDIPKIGNDTMIVKAKYLGEVMIPENSDKFLLLLDSKGILKSKDYHSSIQFKIDGCNQTYNLLKYDKGCLKCDNLNYNQNIILTCVVLPYNSLSKLKSEPPVIVINIKKSD